MNTSRSGNAAAVVLAFISLIFFCLMIVVNGMANSQPINGMTTGEVSALYPNLFVPSGLTFSIWGLIYLLLTLFVAYALSLALSKGAEPYLSNGDHILFSLSSILNALWIYLWHYKAIGWSLVVMLGILITLSVLYFRLDIIHIGKFWHRLAVKIPVSIYLGWITVATIANTTAWLVSKNWSGWGIEPNTWAVFMIIAGFLITTIMLLSRKNIPYALVVIWAYAGIIIKRRATDPVHQDIILTAVLVVVLLSLMILNQLFKNKSSRK